MSTENKLAKTLMDLLDRLAGEMVDADLQLRKSEDWVRTIHELFKVVANNRATELRKSIDISPMDYNVGTSNYSSLRLQPWDIWEKSGLDPFRADIIKRLLRTKSTDSMVMDMEKIKHICDKIIQLNEETDYYVNFGKGFTQDKQ